MGERMTADPKRLHALVYHDLRQKFTNSEFIQHLNHCDDNVVEEKWGRALEIIIDDEDANYILFFHFGKPCLYCSLYLLALAAGARPNNPKIAFVDDLGRGIEFRSPSALYWSCASAAKVKPVNPYYKDNKTGEIDYYDLMSEARNKEQGSQMDDYEDDIFQQVKAHNEAIAKAEEDLVSGLRMMQENQADELSSYLKVYKELELTEAQIKQLNAMDEDSRLSTLHILRCDRDYAREEELKLSNSVTVVETIKGMEMSSYKNILLRAMESDKTVSAWFSAGSDLLKKAENNWNNVRHPYWVWVTKFKDLNGDKSITFVLKPAPWGMKPKGLTMIDSENIHQMEVGQPTKIHHYITNMTIKHQDNNYLITGDFTYSLFAPAKTDEIWGHGESTYNQVGDRRISMTTVLAKLGMDKRALSGSYVGTLRRTMWDEAVTIYNLADLIGATMVYIKIFGFWTEVSHSKTVFTTGVSNGASLTYYDQVIMKTDLPKSDSPQYQYFRLLGGVHPAVENKYLPQQYRSRSAGRR